MPENYYFGGGGATLVTPLSLVVLGTTLVLLALLPRRYVIVPLLASALLIPLGNQIVVSGVHFMTYRLVLLAGWMRIGSGILRERRFPRLNRLDKAFLVWALASALIYTLLWGQWEAVMNRLGFLYSTLGAYFLLRYLIRTPDDVRRTIKTLAVIMAIIAPLMLWEHWTGHNLFSWFGGVDALSPVRNGRIRAQGPFAHSIIAGTCGAALLPLFLSLWWSGKNRLIVIAGVIASTLMAVASSSSTPIATYVAGVGALCVWPLRRNMRPVRWCLVGGVIALHLVMRAPVWFVISRMSGVLGGSGWHRAQLIDQFIRHANEWWLIGTRNSAYWGLDMWDAINAYVSAGVNGGILTFCLFISILALAYRTVGRARALAETRATQLQVWALGAGLFANTVAFFGIVYFDQSAIVWYALLVMISVTSASVLSARRAREAEASPGSTETDPVAEHVYDYPVGVGYAPAIRNGQI